MKIVKPCLLWTLSLAVATLASAADSEFSSPLPVRTKDDPLPVSSPVRVDWKGPTEMEVGLELDGQALFPTFARYTNLVSGCEFHLDPGLYRLNLREANLENRRAESSRQSMETWLLVRQQPMTFDLRAQAPGSKAQVADLRRQLSDTQSRIDAVSTSVDQLSEKLTPVEDGLLILLKKFTLVDKRGENSVAIDQPFQWLADRIGEIEATIPEIESAQKKK